MKPLLKPQQIFKLLLCIGLCWPVSSVRADVSYSANAALSFTLDSVVNLNSADAGNVSGFSAQAAFQQIADPSYQTVSGDGYFSANNADIAATPLLTGFSNTFSISAVASDGSVDTVHTGSYSLSFFNNSQDDYTVDLSLNYVLNAVASGLYAGSSVYLDYYYDAGSFSGFDYVSAITPTLGGAADNETQPGTLHYSFTLPAGASGTFYADALISGDLLATPAPVPAPSAIWQLLGGLLGWIGLSRRVKFTGRGI